MALEEIDWEAVFKTVGAILSGGFITGWLAKIWERREKREDRRQTHNETFRSELRQAYAQFVAAQSKRLHLLSDLDTVIGQIHKAEIEVRNREPALRYPKRVVEEEHPHWIAKARDLRDALAQAHSDTAFRLAELILLEEDAVMSASLVAFFETLGWPEEESTAKDNGVEVQIAAYEKGLRELVSKRAGAFAPEQWDRSALRRRSTTANAAPKGRP